MICTAHLVDVSIDGKIILKWILKKKSRRVWTGFFWLRIDTRGGDGNVYTTTTQHKTFLDQLQEGSDSEEPRKQEPGS